LPLVRAHHPRRASQRTAHSAGRPNLPSESSTPQNCGLPSRVHRAAAAAGRWRRKRNGALDMSTVRHPVAVRLCTPVYDGACCSRARALHNGRRVAVQPELDGILQLLEPPTHDGDTVAVNDNGAPSTSPWISVPGLRSVALNNTHCCELRVQLTHNLHCCVCDDRDGRLAHLGQCPASGFHQCS